MTLSVLRSTLKPRYRYAPTPEYGGFFVPPPSKQTSRSVPAAAWLDTSLARRK